MCYSRWFAWWSTNLCRASWRRRRWSWTDYRQNLSDYLFCWRRRSGWRWMRWGSRIHPSLFLFPWDHGWICILTAPFTVPYWALLTLHGSPGNVDLTYAPVASTSSLHFPIPLSLSFSYYSWYVQSQFEPTAPPLLIRPFSEPTLAYWTYLLTAGLVIGEWS